LSDFSVHSFADLGISSYLLLFLAVIGLPALALYIIRLKDMTASRKYEEIYEKWTSRDFGIFIGASVLLATGLVTLLGTSAPLLTRIFGESQAVDTNFYNITNYPLAVLVAIIMGMFPIFRWGTDELKSASSGLLGSFVIAAIGTIAVILAGGSGAAYLIFMFVSLFGLLANLYMLGRTIRNGLKHIGSYATHLGVALVFAGIIATGGWAVTERVMIPIGGTAETAGLTIEAATPRTSTDGSTVYVPLKLYKDGKLFQEGEPYMQKTKMDNTLRHPMIHSTLTEDIYISPLTLSGSTTGMTAMGGTELEVKKGGSVSAEGLTIDFSAFDISGMNEGKVGADIKVSETGKTLYEGKIFMSVAVANVEGSSVIIDGSSGKFSLSMSGIDASSGKIYLNLAKASEAATTSAGSFLVEVSRKPFVSLLWIGACLIVAGATIA
ncbi:MAG TPA: cytochrome c-type biogenesis CcmF C-terminal domain-containing protein, partial [Bacillota bacterium]|nr:cytochrome c-type biogenesis CcmF C-terminal domain-containing protein [Bacillota bacterium]